MSQPSWGPSGSYGSRSTPAASPYGPAQPPTGQPYQYPTAYRPQLPPHYATPYGPTSPTGPWGPAPLRRPAVVTMAAVMAVTASLQFVCVVGFLWLVAYAGMQDFPNSDLGADSAAYHLFRRFHLAMLEGLAWPLFLIPLASFALGFLVLLPRPWTRWALTLLGLGALAWSGVWLHRQIMWWLPAALYVLVACLILWTPAASAWYRARGRPVSGH